MQTLLTLNCSTSAAASSHAVQTSAKKSFPLFDDHTFTVFIFYYLYGSTIRCGLYFTNMVHHSSFFWGGPLSATNYLFYFRNLLKNNNLIFKYSSGDKSGGFVLVAAVAESHPLPEFREAGFSVAVAHWFGHIIYGLMVGAVIGLIGY